MGTSSHAKSTWSVRERPKTGPRPSLETADPQKRSFHLPLTLTKGDISKSLERGHFYFPLTCRDFHLTNFSESHTIPLIMPNLKAAIKDLRQSKDRAVHNKLVKDELHSLRRYLRKALETKDVSKAQELAKTLIQKFDKAVQKNILKQNTAARYKSRMMQKVNALSQK